LLALVVSVPEFQPEFFLTLLYVKRRQINPKRDIQNFWGKHQVILSWFASLVSFCAKSHEILTETYLSRIDEKHQ